MGAAAALATGVAIGIAYDRDDLLTHAGASAITRQATTARNRDGARRGDDEPGVRLDGRARKRDGDRQREQRL
jgi:hypothetical protein